MSLNLLVIMEIQNERKMRSTHSPFSTMAQRKAFCIGEAVGQLDFTHTDSKSANHFQQRAMRKKTDVSIRLGQE